MYRIVQLDADAAEAFEQMGTKAKFWFLEPNGGKAIFKLGREGTGENWAEKAAAELCRLIGIPCAEYELAEWKGRQGVLSPIFVPLNGRLVPGNELFAKIDPGYVATLTYGQSSHTLSRVMAILRRPLIALPIGFEPVGPVTLAAHVFVGYLMLDALIGNTDRHHENWGLILRPTEAATVIHLAPTFDHASSLGRNESDQRRQDRLVTRDRTYAVEAYASRARSALYRKRSDARPMLTMEAFQDAATLYPEAADYWIDKMRAVDFEQMREVLYRIPDAFISGPARDFAIKVIEINRTRIIGIRRPA